MKFTLKTPKFFYLVIFSFCLRNSAVAQQSLSLKLANIFSDNMVIQQGINSPIWGFANPKEKIRIEFAGKRTIAKVDKDGKWMIKLPAQKAGGPYSLKVTSKTCVVEFKNVMVGEVWLASGQSNMEFMMYKASNASHEISTANYPEIRLFSVPVSTSVQPLTDLSRGKWVVCDPSSVKSFSAVAFFFAQEIYKQRKVPVGIINASLGSSAAEAWTSRNMLEELPEFKDRLLRIDTDTTKWNEKVLKIKQYESEERKSIVEKASDGIRIGAHNLDYDDQAWKSSTFPMNMKKIGLPGYWGFVWFRKEFNLTEEQAKYDLLMELPIYCDDFSLYFNGIDVGNFNKQPVLSSYVIPKGSAKVGKNVIALRIRTYFGTAYIGTEDSPMPKISAKDYTFNVPISGNWKYNATIEPKIYANQEYFNTPTVLYNGMIAPIIPYRIKGVIWYQGESNANRPIEYRTLFPSLIKNWRNTWNQGDFPFLFVQLASRKKEGEQDLQYALARESQTYALKLPNTAMATAVDLGEKYDTHPKNKDAVGKRLALAALKVAYNEDVVYSGPVYKSMKIENDSIRLSFSHLGSGLMIKGAELNGLKIAGKDHEFYNAKAFISGNQVMVYSSMVKEPIAVRYCFESWSEGNLYNKEGIATPQFRTDDWEVVKNSK